MREMMRRLKLTVNDTKTRVCRLPKDTVDFLGYTLGRRYSPRTGRAYLGTWPSKPRVQRLCAEISERTSRRWHGRDALDLVPELNRKLRGWANYFCLGPVSRAYRAVDAHVTARLRQWLCGKHQKSSRGFPYWPDRYLTETLGLLRLPLLPRTVPCAHA